VRRKEILARIERQKAIEQSVSTTLRNNRMCVHHPAPFTVGEHDEVVNSEVDIPTDKVGKEVYGIFKGLGLSADIKDDGVTKRNRRTSKAEIRAFKRRATL